MHETEGRADQLLAWLVQQEDRSTPIAQLQNRDVDIVFSQAEINETFRFYYACLYERREGCSSEVADIYNRCH